MKTFFTLMFCLVVMVGCGDYNHLDDKANTCVYKSKKDQWEIQEWNGHTYVVNTGYGYGRESGITHNPDCKCYKKESVEVPKPDPEYEKYLELKKKYENK